MKYSKVVYSMLALALAGCASMGKTAEPDPEADLAYCNEKVHEALANLPADTTVMPRNIEGDARHWACRPIGAEEWCSGFWPGVLWYDYEYSRDPAVREAAAEATRRLEPILERPVFDHDLGFLMYCSFGNAYRLTGDDHYRKVIVNAADSLATLFNPAVGTLLAWPRHVKDYGGHNTIMDTMINLEMLFFAAKNGGNPYCYDIAVSHAETTMRHHFRPDGSCYHVAVYDPESGRFLRGCTHQGYADGSMWARGQAWPTTATPWCTARRTTSVSSTSPARWPTCISTVCPTTACPSGTSTTPAASTLPATHRPQPWWLPPCSSLKATPTRTTPHATTTRRARCSPRWAATPTAAATATTRSCFIPRAIIPPARR